MCRETLFRNECFLGGFREQGVIQSALVILSEIVSVTGTQRWKDKSEIGEQMYNYIKEKRCNCDYFAFFSF
jgi:hypothetical protein